jgi:signal transduction histidine kinase
MINTSGQHLLALINDVLDLAKVEAGKVTVALEEFDVADVADEVVTALGPDSSAKGLAVNFARPDTAVNVFSDCGKVRQILLNLAGNAVKFTEAGHIDVTVSVRDDGAASISVADTGPGISPEDMSRIFEAFQQIETPDAAKPQGTGLGLALCREHARLLGAEISAESVVGKGSTFTLVLPVTQNA